MLTFGVVLFSLVVQGLTIKPVVGWLGLQQKAQSVEVYERTLLVIQRFQAGKSALEQLRELSESVADEERKKIIDRIEKQEDGH